MARKGGSWIQQEDGSLIENKPGGAEVKPKSVKAKESKKDKPKPKLEPEPDKE